MRAKVPGILLAIGALMVLLGMTSGLLGLLPALAGAGPSWATPGARDLTLQPGRWVLYQRAPSVTTDPGIPIRQVSVYGPAGRVDVGCVYCGGSSMTLTTNGRTYLGIAAFDVPTEGTYKITVTTPGEQVMVARSVTRGILAFLGGFMLAMAGGVTCFIAITWLVLGAIIPARTKQPPPASAG